jgi:hypothetical protein
VILTKDRTSSELAVLNQISGPAFTLVDGNEPIACAGYRIHGIAEAWCALSEEAKDKYLLMVIRRMKKEMDKIQRKEQLYKIYAESDISDNFLEHLGFVKQGNIFVR